jgi:ribosomal protein S27AE
MLIATAHLAPSAKDLSRPNCPRCGSVLLVAEQSAFNLDGRIRHNWACDDCGNEFVTSLSVLLHKPESDGHH